MKRILLVILAAIVLIAGGAVAYTQIRPGGVPVYRANVVETLPHDRTAFTEGLFIDKGVLYESTGRVGESFVRKVDLATGKVQQEQALPAPYFGEGIVAWGDKLYQLTWQDQTGFVYGLDKFEPRGTFSYTGEGWSLTRNDKAIIMSDGTPVLRFLDPSSMQVTSTLRVTANGCPVANLNELEWVDGAIYANIWQTNLIAKIDPTSGKVLSFLDVTALGPQNRGADDVANGIAYDAEGKRLFVTGKLWSQLYQVREGDRVRDSAEAAKLTTCAN
ncbi:glutaminyl-peptide cyclotransferase [Sphingomonas sp. HT-1]|uniref:glutaminyl-peptide cyclotransferase n=1 Tax=unclassified Sphingomonas TaxID=196159 RepID=UPI00030F9D77|nr:MULTISPECIES: glutaminyl-peptide cyclotransferase [unclassified Sphingomonas]KTF70324.1 glutamine cyclotransferase [Sphingomonas sp. WG]